MLVTLKTVYGSNYVCVIFQKYPNEIFKKYLKFVSNE